MKNIYISKIKPVLNKILALTLKTSSSVFSPMLFYSTKST